MAQNKILPGAFRASQQTIPALKIGTRVRSIDDQVEGRIIWANAVSVKIKWVDGEQVTWKRAELASKDLEFLDPADEPKPHSAEPAATESGPMKAVESDQVGDNPQKKMSALDAAAKVLAESKKPMSCQELIDVMAIQNYWSSPGGKTPAATLYSAILRELAKGEESRFVKVGRGMFAHKS